MFCSKCGNEVKEEERFCSKCGNQINTKEIEARSNTNTDKKSSQAMVGFILGLCSIIAWVLPIVGYPVTITGIVFSSKGMSSNNNGKAIVGLVLSIIFLVVTLINSIAGAIIGMEAMSNLYYY